MKQKGLSLRLVAYELRNVSGNWYVMFFGIVFPILLSVVLAGTVAGQLPSEIKKEVVTTMVLTISLVIPMSIMLLGYAALYANEVEKGIPLRLRLFGYKEKTIMIAKIIAHLIFMTIAFLIFAVAEPLLLDILIPKAWALVCLVICLYVLGIIFLIMAHAIANLCGKFGPTYAITMVLYFLIMILSGMMGARTEQLPEVLQKIARTMPMTYISNDFIDFWQGGSYNFVPMIQSYLFLGAVAGILLMASLHKNKRRQG